MFACEMISLSLCLTLVRLVVLREKLILVCFLSVCFLFFSGAGACEVALQFCKRSVFPTWAGVTYFNNNNNYEHLFSMFFMPPCYNNENAGIYIYIVNLAFIDIILGIKANEKNLEMYFLRCFSPKKMILSNILRIIFIRKWCII